MKVETTRLPCGLFAYTGLAVPHDWNPPALNKCDCGRAIARWNVTQGHVCECGKTCDGGCVRVAA